MIRPSLLPLVLLVLTFMSQPLAAVTWSLSGPGVTNITTSGNSVTVDYNLDVRRTYGQFEWKLVGGLFAPGLHQFDWVYTGIHDLSQSGTFLLAGEEPWVEYGQDSTGRSNAFSYSGRSYGVSTSRYSKLQFTFGGTNDDTTGYLQGRIVMSMVPVPATLWMGIAGCMALGWVGYRRRAAAYS